MKFLELPDWLYFPFKLLLMAAFLIPVLLWGGQMLGISKAQETALILQEVQSADRRAGQEWKSIHREGEVFESQAAAVTGRMEKEGTRLLADATRKSSKKTPVHSQGTAEITGSARGIDASHYQGMVYWDRVAASGIHFGYVKATAGEHYIDPRFHENWHGMRAAEVYRGAYHFYYAAENPVAQAKHFIATVRKLHPMDLPPVLDVEISDHTDKKDVLEGALIWLATVEKALGKRPMLYTDPGFGDHYLEDSRLARYPLWIADYGKKIDSVPSPWAKEGWSFWQHSQHGKVQGVDAEVDLNVFKGTIAELKKFINES